jgi:hypothetical protein
LNLPNFTVTVTAINDMNSSLILYSMPVETKQIDRTYLFSARLLHIAPSTSDYAWDYSYNYNTWGLYSCPLPYTPSVTSYCVGGAGSEHSFTSETDYLLSDPLYLSPGTHELWMRSGYYNYWKSRSEYDGGGSTWNLFYTAEDGEEHTVKGGVVPSGAVPAPDDPWEQLVFSLEKLYSPFFEKVVFKLEACPNYSEAIVESPTITSSYVDYEADTLTVEFDPPAFAARAPPYCSKLRYKITTSNPTRHFYASSSPTTLHEIDATKDEVLEGELTVSMAVAWEGSDSFGPVTESSAIVTRAPTQIPTAAPTHSPTGGCAEGTYTHWPATSSYCDSYDDPLPSWCVETKACYDCQAGLYQEENRDMVQQGQVQMVVQL